MGVSGEGTNDGKERWAELEEQRSYAELGLWLETRMSKSHGEAGHISLNTVFPS